MCPLFQSLLCPRELLVGDQINIAVFLSALLFADLAALIPRSNGSEEGLHLTLPFLAHLIRYRKVSSTARSIYTPKPAYSSCPKNSNPESAGKSAPGLSSAAKQLQLLTNFPKPELKRTRFKDRRRV